MPDTILLLMKIALVHDYLIEAGGAERVLRVLSEMYPEAPIYTAFVRRESRAGKMFSDRRVIESRWGKLLKIGKMYSYLRFLQPMVWKSLDLSEYDLVITSCSGYIARGFWVGKKTRVVAYCHTPPKWLYGYETPTRARGKWWGKIYLWVWGPFVRYFDYTAAQRVDTWMANSQEVARRIKKFYGKNSIVVYCLVSANSKTGVEMEALTAVTAALMTLYDMAKSIDHDMVIGEIRLDAKTGGSSGDYVRSDARAVSSE